MILYGLAMLILSPILLTGVTGQMAVDYRNDNKNKLTRPCKKLSKKEKEKLVIRDRKDESIFMLVTLIGIMLYIIYYAHVYIKLFIIWASILPVIYFIYRGWYRSGKAY